MSIENAIYSHLSTSTPLSALVGTQIYPAGDVSPDATRPYVLYEMVTDDKVPYLGGFSGHTFKLFQFSVIALTQISAIAIAEAIRNRMDGFRGLMGTGGSQVRVQDVRHVDSGDLQYEPHDNSDVFVPGIRLDYRISYAESVPTFA